MVQPRNGGPKQSAMEQAIVSPALKAGQFFASLLVWYLFFTWIHSLVLFSTGADFFRSRNITDGMRWEAWSQAFWVIGLIILIRLAQLAVDWAVLIPLEARNRGMDTRNPSFTSDLKEYAKKRLVREGLVLAILVAVTVLARVFLPL